MTPLAEEGDRKPLALSHSRVQGAHPRGVGGEGLTNGCGKLTGGKGNFSDGAARRSPAREPRLIRAKPDTGCSSSWLRQQQCDTHEYNDTRNGAAFVPE